MIDWSYRLTQHRKTDHWKIFIYSLLSYIFLKDVWRELISIYLTEVTRFLLLFLFVATLLAHNGADSYQSSVIKDRELSSNNDTVIKSIIPCHLLRVVVNVRVKMTMCYDGCTPYFIYVIQSRAWCKLEVLNHTMQLKEKHIFLSIWKNTSKKRCL
ncbi:hypothetical protein L596_021722 [Steinernema carpocapsae]|uniref:Uncharacterized protein n=1 Tax=Steinernema carpocapsae TaxID=34508 RepID=A0A4U5MJY4_STECR|nr:hypothetical protein L596_021722 [Steinernema carpocapsae]